MATFPNPFSRQYLMTAIEQRPTRAALKQNYIGLDYFPMQRVSDYELTWDLIKSGNHLAGIYAHDGVPTPGLGYDYESLVADIMHIMATRDINPDVVMKLRDAGELSVHNNLTTGLRQKYLSKVNASLGECQDEVDAVIEYLCINSLLGTIAWPPTDNDGNEIANAPSYWGDIAFSLDLGFRSTFKQSATTLSGYNSRAGGGYVWSNASADPVLDLEVIAELIRETTGLDAHGSTVIMSRTIMGYLSRNTAILQWIRGTYGPAGADIGGGMVSEKALQDYILTHFGYTFRLYDSIWTYETGRGSASGHTENQVRFLPRGKIIILPNGSVGAGNSFFATAPDLGAPNGENLGLYTWSTQKDSPPWTTSVGCGIHGFPILKSTQEIFVFNVLA